MLEETWQCKLFEVFISPGKQEDNVMDNAQTTIRVEARMIGKRKALGAPWYVALPPEFLHAIDDPDQPLLLRDLITHIVLAEVRAFRLRQEERRLLRVLSPQEMNEAAGKGKISLGDEQGPARTEVDEHEAVEVALQAFEDGIYLVFLDTQQQRDLANPVLLHADSTLLFIRLVALVGG